jgi:hypothetical protein
MAQERTRENNILYGKRVLFSPALHLTSFRGYGALMNSVIHSAQAW